MGGFISFRLFMTTSIVDSLFFSRVLGEFTKTSVSAQFPTLFQSFATGKIPFGLDISPASVHVVLFLFFYCLLVWG